MGSMYLKKGKEEREERKKKKPTQTKNLTAELPESEIAAYILVDSYLCKWKHQLFLWSVLKHKNLCIISRIFWIRSFTGNLGYSFMCIWGRYKVEIANFH